MFLLTVKVLFLVCVSFSLGVLFNDRRRRRQIERLSVDDFIALQHDFVIAKLVYYKMKFDVWVDINCDKLPHYQGYIAWDNDQRIRVTGDSLLLTLKNIDSILKMYCKDKVRS